MAHALNVVLNVAKRFSQDSKVHFLFVGEGAEKENLKQLAERLSLDNLTFLGEQPRERLLGFYRASDVSLVPLRKLEIFRKVLPSKLFELMGVGCPIICSVEGEAARLVAAAEAGLCIEPENADTLFAAINRLRAEPELRTQMSSNGQQFVKTHYLRSVLAEKYLSVVGDRLSVAGKYVQGTPRVQEAPSADHRPPTTNY